MKCRDVSMWLEPRSWAGFCWSPGQLYLPSPRPSVPPSKVKFPVWWWKAQGRLPMWLPAWWRWRMPWRHPSSRKSWCASYPALCPGCLRRRSRVGSNGWVVGSKFLGRESAFSAQLHSQLGVFILSQWLWNGTLAHTRFFCWKLKLT